MTWDDARARVEQMAADYEAVTVQNHGGVAPDEIRDDADALRLLLAHAVPREDRVRALLDALTGYAYHDDGQVVEIAAVKRYGEMWQTHIRVETA